jgi:peptide/nickel transport system substrate-binding protein
VDFSAPSAQFLVGMSTVVFGMVSDATLAMSADERCQGGFVGTGPFTLDSYQQDQSARVVKRAGYAWASSVADHTGEAYLDSIDFSMQPVASVRAGALTSGQSDVALVLETPDVPTIEATGATVVSATMPGLPSTLIPNLDRPAVADPAVREAMNVAIDRSSIVSAVLGEHFVPAYSMLTSNLPEYEDFSGEELSFDPDQARQILDGAGWTAGSDGVRTRDGVRLAISLSYSEDGGGIPYASVLQLVQQQLEDIGFEVTLDANTAAQFSEAWTSKDYDFFVTTLTESDPQIVQSLIQGRYDQSLLDQLGLPTLLSQQQAAADPAARKAIWSQIQSIMIENGMAVPVFQSSQMAAEATNVQGLRFEFRAVASFYDVSLSA